MTAHGVRIALSALMAVLLVGQVHGVAATLPSVRVIAAEATVFERPNAQSHVTSVAPAGTILELIDRQDAWYWVLLPRDDHGTRHTGWVQAHDVVVTARSRDSFRTLQEELSVLPPAVDRNARKAERAEVRRAAEEARVKARIEQASRKVEQARREYEALTKTVDEAAVP